MQSMVYLWSCIFYVLLVAFELEQRIHFPISKQSPGKISANISQSQRDAIRKKNLIFFKFLFESSQMGVACVCLPIERSYEWLFSNQVWQCRAERGKPVFFLMGLALRPAHWVSITHPSPLKFPPRQLQRWKKWQFKKRKNCCLLVEAILILFASSRC
jgi:hypothetical protein